MAFNSKSPMIKENSIVILDEFNEFVSIYSVNNGNRGRELAERDLRYKSGRQAFFINNQKEMVKIDWVIGKYGDQILDSEILPYICRAHSLLK